MTILAYPKKVDDIISISSFLINLEADKGTDWIYGGVKIGVTIDAWCRVCGIERPVLEEIVWPSTKLNKADLRITGK